MHIVFLAGTRISIYARYMRARFEKEKRKKRKYEAFVMEGVEMSMSTLSNGLKRSLCSYEVDSLRID